GCISPPRRFSEHVSHGPLVLFGLSVDPGGSYRVATMGRNPSGVYALTSDQATRKPGHTFAVRPRRSCRASIGERYDAGTERFALGQLQLRRDHPIPEKALAAPNDSGMNKELILVDQVGLHQRLDKNGTADNDDVLTGFLLQPGYFFGDIRLDNGRVVPV